MNCSRSTKPLSGRRVAAIGLRTFAHARETSFSAGNGSRIRPLMMPVDGSPKVGLTSISESGAPGATACIRRIVARGAETCGGILSV